MAAPVRDGQGHRPLRCSPAVPGGWHCRAGAVPDARAVPRAQGCARCPRASSLDAQPGPFRRVQGGCGSPGCQQGALVMGTTPAWWRPHAQPSPLCTGAPQAGRLQTEGWAQGRRRGSCRHSLCSRQWGREWFLLHENKGVARYSFFYPIQRKTKITMFVDLSIFRYWELTLKNGAPLTHEQSIGHSEISVVTSRHKRGPGLRGFMDEFCENFSKLSILLQVAPENRE